PQPSAHKRTERRGHGRPRRPVPHGRAARLAGERSLQERETVGDDERARRALQHARDDEERQVRRDRAPERRDRESREPEREHAAAREAVAERAAEENERAEREQIAVEHPLQSRDAEMEIARDRRERDRRNE